MSTLQKPARKKSLLLVIDIQEKLLGAMQKRAAEQFLKQIKILLESANVLALPILYTEQYPKGLGRTIEPLTKYLGTSPRFEKTVFSAYASVETKQAIEQSRRKQVIVCGMESHVCVYQTVRDLLEDNYTVFVPEEAVLSRSDSNRKTGLRLMEKAGAQITSIETVLFDLLGNAKDPSFKEISRLIR